MNVLIVSNTIFHLNLNISPYKHVIESQQFSINFIDALFSETDKIKKAYLNRNSSTNWEYDSVLKGKCVALLFYEPSTRTRFSFQRAAQALGATTLATENASEFSSAAKGETLEDTIRVTSAYADYIVLRHKENDSSERAAAVSKVPIINAGSGTGQHPTQALLDAYTIHNHFKRTSHLNICVVGDLLRGRTVNSLIYLLSPFNNENEFVFVSPDNCRIKDGIKKHLSGKGLRYYETDDLNSALKTADVVYVTRIQKERFDDQKEYDKAKGRFIINKDNINLMSEDAIIMHPLPRVDEISTEVDSNKRAKYFDQAENGLYVRMALLKILNDNYFK